MIPLTEIIRENERRRELYFRDYSREHGDPTSETVIRKPLVINGKLTYLPLSMFDIPVVIALRKYGSFKNIIIKTTGEHCKEKEAKLHKGFIKDRFNHDFEFWAFTTIKIQDKVSKQYIPFKLNRGQRRLLALLEEMRLADLPIRVILLKARQWGGSTLTQIYMLWLQLFHFTNWHSAIVSQLKVQATNVRNMITKVISNYPAKYGKPTMKTVSGTQSMKYIVERGCEIQVGSAEQPDAIRSFDISMAHMTEVAFWASTQAKSGDDLIQSLYAAIPSDVPGTFIMMESTAKGVGDFFHTQWLAATTSGSQYRPIFVPWFEMELYTRPIKDYKKFVESMSEYDLWQWKQGATLEGINWYKNYQKDATYSDFRMRSEYPTTAEEAFQSNTSSYFKESFVEKARSTCKDPIWIGDIRGDSLSGPDSLKGITLYERDSGSETLKVWIFPESNPDEIILHRFLVIVDIGGKSHKSDNSVISVFDRLALIDPFGAMERAALWVGHVDHDILAWKAAQIAKHWDNALLVIESNTIDTRDKKQMDTILYEGDHFYTVIDEISDHYENLYARGDAPDKAIESGRPLKFGWHMNKKTKYQAYDKYSQALREDNYVERSHEAVNEMQWLQIKSNGQIEAASGKRDDIMDTTAVGVFIGYEEMPLPRIIQTTDKANHTLRQRKSVGVAGF